MLKLLKRFFLFSLVTVGAMIGAYLFLSVALSVLATSPKTSQCQKENEIFISTNGVHLDLIVPRGLLTSKLLQALELPPGVSYVTFGWGNREFYLNTPTWSEFSILTGFKATFFGGQTVIHTGLYNDKQARWLEVQLCNYQMKLLNQYLENWFSYDQQDNLTQIKASGYPATDRFYAAKGSYSGIMTCNNWVNNGLKAAEIKTSIWSPFDKGVLYHVRKHNSDRLVGNTNK